MNFGRQALYAIFEAFNWYLEVFDMNEEPVTRDHPIFKGMQIGLSNTGHMDLIRTHDFNVWAIKEINQARRPYQLVGWLLALSMAVLVWLGVHAAFESVPTSIKVSLVLGLSIAGLGIVKLIGYELSKPRMREVNVLIERKANRLGIPE